MYIASSQKLFLFTKLQICLSSGPKTDPDTRDQIDISADKEILKTFISKCLLKVDANPSIEESCMYTVRNVCFMDLFIIFFTSIEYS